MAIIQLLTSMWTCYKDGLVCYKDAVVDFFKKD